MCDTCGCGQTEEYDGTTPIQPVQTDPIHVEIDVTEEGTVVTMEDEDV